MSKPKEQIVDCTGAGIEFATTAQPNPVIPTWLPEALLLGEWWRASGLLEQLQQQVRVSRGRMGQYEVCDFVLVLLAYAVSGEASLGAFFKALTPVKDLLMAVWGRARCPVASTLSRFLNAIETTPVENLRQLFESNVRQQSVPSEANGGLYGRRGERYWVFDLDGTHEATRQRALPTTEEYPQLRRRSEQACAPGLLGRKRGQVTRTRSALQQAHTSEWLGSFGAPGNGTAQPDLVRACEVIKRYSQQQGIAAAAVIVRLDGYYGLPAFVNVLQQAGFGFLLRGRDYQILNYPQVQTKLAQTTAQLWQHPETKQQREVFELGFLEESWSGYSQPIRVIVMRSPLKPGQKPRIGKRIGEHAHELVLTSIPVHALNAVDIVSLYLGRGGFEKSLGDEDRECDCDRWCSWHPLGQEFWQILAQWVWNWRVWVGWKQHPESMRQTLWQPATDIDAPSISETGAERTVPATGATKTHSPLADTTSVQYGPMQVVESWARSNGKFAGKDFTIESERSLRCPAGHSMYRREVRQNGRGDLLLVFSINRRTCWQCPLRDKCVADGSGVTNGRRITVVRRKLADAAAPVDNSTSPTTRGISVPRIKAIHPVLWVDLPAVFLRRDLSRQLRQHQIQLDAIVPTTKQRKPTPLLSRAQRAHRRLNWSDRLGRNALDPEMRHWKVRLFGISSPLATFIEDLTKPSVTSH